MNESDYAFAQYVLEPNVVIERAEERSIHQPPTGDYIKIHLQTICYDFHVPTRPLMSATCNFYRILSGMLSLNSHRLIACLQTLCQFCGMDTSLELFHQLFQLTKIDTTSTGYLNASQRDRCKVVGRLNISLKGWREKLFFVQPAQGEFSFLTTWGGTYY